MSKLDKDGVRVGATVARFLFVAGAAAAALVCHSALAQTTPDADFAARCAAPGVLICNGFDQASDLAAVPPGSGLEQANDNTTQGSIDTATKASGAGSLKFKLRAGVTFANIGGAFSSPLGKAFQVGSTIYVQWRQLVTPEYLTNNIAHWGSSIKQVNIHGPSSTCQSAEFTTVTANNTTRVFNYPSMYNNCGDGFNTDPVTNQLCNNCPNGGPMLQQGANSTSGYNCNYQNQVPGTGNGPGCFSPLPNIWYTYYEEITIGAVGANASAVNGYVASNGGPYKQWQRASGILFPGGGDNNFTNIRLETYMTELPKGGTAATVDAFVWYDELIVSTKPIPAPGVAPFPIPQNLRTTP
jgi:hypothetical protein